jgi:hypothetical protein
MEAGRDRDGNREKHVCGYIQRAAFPCSIGRVSCHTPPPSSWSPPLSQLPSPPRCQILTCRPSEFQFLRPTPCRLPERGSTEGILRPSPQHWESDSPAASAAPWTSFLWWTAAQTSPRYLQPLSASGCGTCRTSRLASPSCPAPHTLPSSPLGYRYLKKKPEELDFFSSTFWGARTNGWRWRALLKMYRRSSRALNDGYWSIDC